MLANPRCLIVDDEADICDLLSITIEKMGIKTDSAQSLEDAKFCLSRHRYDLCLTDMRLPDGNGLDLMKYISLHHSGLPIAVMTVKEMRQFAQAVARDCAALGDANKIKERYGLDKN